MSLSDSDFAVTVTNTTATMSIATTANQKLLTDMPVEIFEKIFSYTGYKEVSNMRLVC